MFDDLLMPDFPENQEPIEKENINQFILYYGDDEFKEMKQMCKDAMKIECPNGFHDMNASDIILIVLKKYHGKDIDIKKKID